MAPPFGLLGPPAIHRLAPSSVVTDPEQPPPMPWLEGQSPTYILPRNSLLDLIFLDPLLETLRCRLEAAWRHDPSATFKFITRLRCAVGGPGKKPDDEAFFEAVLWLHREHPRTLACNVNVFVNNGCLKDLLDILHRVLHSPLTERERREEQMMKKTGGTLQHETRRESGSRKQIVIASAKRVVQRYACDLDYRFLHNQISQIFADLLESDLRFLKSGEIQNISIASKWCPSLDSSYDRSTLICESIAKKLFPRESDDEYKELVEAYYAYRVRNRLQKQVLVPLRKALDSANRVTTVTLRRRVFTNHSELRRRVFTNHSEKILGAYKKGYERLFSTDDDERFGAYAEIADACADGKARSLLPHKIVGSLNCGQGGELAELRWRTLVEDVSKHGKLNNCLAVCDVSEGMKGTRIQSFSIAMSLLISDLNEEPWKGMVFEFGPDPKLRRIEGDNLRSKAEFLREMKSGGQNMSFSKVFDQILQVAQRKTLSPDKMVKRIYVLTFSEKAMNNFVGVWASLARYQRQGYPALPEIVFWNLGASVTPSGRKRHMTTVNGFSEAVVAMLLKVGELPTFEQVVKLAPKPVDALKALIYGDDLRDLVVFD